MQKKVRDKKGKRAATVLVLTVVVLLAGLASASDVAYIYKKDYKVDQNILDVFDEMGLSYQLINEHSLPASFSGYKIIFVGDENFKNPESIPVDEIPTIVANYYHGEEFGLTDFDGISKLGSSTPLEVKKGSSIIQVYTQARYDIGSDAIPYYFLDDENKAPGLQRVASTWVGTAETGTSSQFGDVISYANPGIKLMNGKTTKEKICFFGIIESDYWTPAAREMFKECVGFVSTACEKDSDCGEEEIGEDYCDGNKIYRDVTTYKCINPGETNAECREKTEKEFVKECEHGCENGECMRECVINSDCGTDYSSEGYCKSDDVYKDIFNFTCLFEECVQKNSTEKHEECGTDSCGSWEKYCIGKEVWKNQTCYDKGCLNGECFSKQTINKTFVETCMYGCVDGTCVDECSEDANCPTDYYSDKYCEGNTSYKDFHDYSCDNGACKETVEKELVAVCQECMDGECIGIQCKKNTDCGINGYTGDKYCTNGNVYEDFISYTCHNPGKANSYCSDDTSPILLEYCEGECLNGECITCFTDAQCGKDGFIGERYCNGKDVYQDYQEFSCVNPGTSSSDCQSSVNAKLVKECEEVCVLGECKGIECHNNEECDDESAYTIDECNNPGTIDSYCSHTEINCINNNDCGITGFFGSEYCKDNDLFKDYKNSTCINPGTKESHCIIDSFPRFLQDCGEDQCGEWSYYCINDSVWKKRECYDRGCENGCFSKLTEEKEKVKECEHGCVDGTCTNECSKDADCNDGLFCNGQEKCVQGECVGGTDIDCSQHNILEIATCNNTPDGNPLTWDYRQGFLSYCDESIKGCVIEDFSLTSSCSEQCGAECSVNGDCPEKCSNHKLYTTSKCESCECQYAGDKCVVGKCGAQCDDNSDCQCQKDYCDGTTLVDYPQQGTCGTSGTASCLCSCTPTLIPDAPECKQDECSIDSDCGTDGYGENYCKNDDVWNDFHDFKCLVGECSENITAILHLDCGADSCSSWQNYCIGKEVWKNQTCYDKGCLNGECFSKTSVNKAFVETCKYGCLDGSCTNECSKDSDCHADYYGENYCMNNDSYKDFHDFSCVSGECKEKIVKSSTDCGESEYGEWEYVCEGKSVYKNREITERGCELGKCFSKTSGENEFVKECEESCVSGKCEDITCYKNSDCGTDRWLEKDYCVCTTNVWDFWKEYICENPGTSSSKCSSKETVKLKEACGNDSCSSWQNYCIGKEVWKNQTCYDKGCLNGECFSKQTVNKTFVETCKYGCVDGSCTNECSKDSDCKADYYGDSYCMNNDSYKDFHDFSCVQGECKEKIVKSSTDCGESEYGEWEYVCEGKSVYKNREITERGCELGKCFSKAVGESLFVSECEYGCENGECVGECSKDADCGTDGYGENYCKNDDVWNDFHDFKCLVGECSENITAIFHLDCGEDSTGDWGYYCEGKDIRKKRTNYERGCTNGECYLTGNNEDKFVETCKYECSDGECVGECSKDADCGTDGYGENYCKNDDVWNDFHDFKCLVGECSENITAILHLDCGADSCGSWQNYCIGKEVWKNQTCYDKGCLNGECFSKTSVNKAFVETCNYGCVDGSCTNECSKDSDCHADYYGENYCMNNDSYKDFHDFSCVSGECKEKIVSEKEECGTDSCGEWSYSCKCNELWRERSCTVKGCEAGDCYSKITTQKELAEKCKYFCMDGKCKDFSCGHDLKCPDWNFTCDFGDFDCNMDSFEFFNMSFRDNFNYNLDYNFNFSC